MRLWMKSCGQSKLYSHENSQKEQGNYTDESWKAFETALESAKAVLDNDAEVVLVSGITNIKAPENVKLIKVESARDPLSQRIPLLLLESAYLLLLLSGFVSRIFPASPVPFARSFAWSSELSSSILYPLSLFKTRL